MPSLQGKPKGSKLVLFLKFALRECVSSFFLLSGTISCLLSPLSWATELLFVASVQRDISRVAKPSVPLRRKILLIVGHMHKEPASNTL